MPLHIDDIAHILAAHKVPAPQLAAIVADLNRAEAENKAEREAVAVKAKTRFVPVILDPENHLAGQAFAGFVVQVPEDLPADQVLPRLHQAAYTQNREAKRRRWRFDHLRDVVQGLKPKYAKAQSISVKGKQLTEVIVTDGVVPGVAAVAAQAAP